ncbi:hypothetical protein T484DRAFT_1768536, partial [Baffinella frigidus]
VILDSLTLNQKLGDGLEDYWSGGLFVLKVIKGTCVANDCVFYSQRGSGVVVTRQGNAVLERCTITECGHYGIGADGPSVVVDCRQTSVKDCKFEDCDSRNGARIVGIDDFAHVVVAVAGHPPWFQSACLWTLQRYLAHKKAPTP